MYQLLFDYFCQYHWRPDFNTYTVVKHQVLTNEDVDSAICENYVEVHQAWLRWDKALVTEQIHKAKELGIHFTSPYCPDYPDGFYELEKPSYLLSYRGNPCWKEYNTLGVVGARESRPDSLQWMESHLNTFLERKKVALVSGGARGIDQKAHSLAIRNKVPTVVFLPSGILNPYPQTMEDWMQPVVDGGGAMVSELWLHQPMQKHHFHSRNRLISAMSDYLLIVEASQRSGTMVTALNSLDQSKSLGVVPGHPMDSHFQGSLNLILQGGHLIRDAYDLIICFDLVNKKSKKFNQHLVYGEF